MENSKIFGIPLALLVFVLLLALLVDLPMVLLNRNLQNEVGVLRFQQVNTGMAVEKLLVTPSVEPTATPSATPTTAVKAFKTVVTPHATTQVK